jgi:hypothetical protein
MMLLFKQALPAFFLYLTTCLTLSETAYASNDHGECATHGLAKPKDPYWRETIERRGAAPYSPEPKDYKVNSLKRALLRY